MDISLRSGVDSQKIFTALSDPTRRIVLEALKGKPRTVADIASQVPVSRPAVSQHLKVLQEAGLVNVRAQGTRRFYSLRREGLDELRKYIDGFWEDVVASYAAKILKTNTDKPGEIDRTKEK